MSNDVLDEVKIYRVNDAEWIATDRSKEDTAEWYVTDYDMGDPDILNPLDEWEDVSLETVHFRDVYEQLKEDGTEDKETMGETIEAMLANNHSLPFLVSTTEW